MIRVQVHTELSQVQSLARALPLKSFVYDSIDGDFAQRANV